MKLACAQCGFGVKKRRLFALLKRSPFSVWCRRCEVFLSHGVDPDRPVVRTSIDDIRARLSTYRVPLRKRLWRAVSIPILGRWYR